VAFGVLLGAGDWSASLGAALVFLVNVVSVNLAALAIFRFRGIEPRRWLKKYEARQSRRRAFVVLGLLIVALTIGIALKSQWLGGSIPAG